MLLRLIVCLTVFTGFLNRASAHVTASLVSDVTTVQPGHAFTVALRLQHEPHWHTYWLNPGTGYATTIAWTLPPGWSAGPILWPTPVILRDRYNSIVGNGYDGETLLPVTVTPPADAKPGETITLRAKADWLMCSDVCMPGGQTVELPLQVAAETPAPDPIWHAKIAALPLPQPSDKAWKTSVVRSDKTVTLTLLPNSEASGSLNEPHFFSEDGFIQFDQPQTARAEKGGFVFTLPISETGEAGTTRLVGVISSQNPFKGLRIDSAFASATPSHSGNVLPTSKTASVGSLAGVLVLAFVGGLILNLMPCVFPVLGIKILGFVNQAGADRRKVTLHGVVFTLGVLSSFWSLASVLAILRASGAELGWGFQLQSPLFVFILAVVMLIFALNMSGLFEVGLRATGVGAGLQSKSGYAGSFFTGVLATVVATPCSAPFLAPALGAALAFPVAESFLVFTVIGIGLSIPYLLLSIFPQAVRLLPRPGAWMETFKQAMAFPLYATVGYLIWVLAGQVQEGALLNAFFGLTLIAMAGWLYGRFTAPGSKPKAVRLGIYGGVILFAAGSALGWPKAASPTDLTWEPWSAEAVAKLQSEGRTVYIDFTARWCATCQANKKLVFGSDEVKKFFRDRKIATLKADWTNRDPKITAELAKWNRSAVPFDQIYKPNSAEPILLPELLTPRIVLNALR